MSMGYIPKKRLDARRRRRVKKKYKNFSCVTCAKVDLGILCSQGKQLTGPSGMIFVGNVKNCKQWKARKEVKDVVTPNKTKKKKFKEFLKRIF